MKILSTILALALLSAANYVFSAVGTEVVKITPAAALTIPVTELSSNLLPDDAAFAEAPVQSFGPPEAGTTVRFLANDRTLFLSLDLTTPEPLPAAVKPTPFKTERDASFAGEEHVSLLFDPGLKLRNYFFINATPANEIADGKMWSYRWNSTTRSSVVKTANGWQLKLAIPLNYFEAAGFGEALFGFNCARTVKFPDGTAQTFYLNGSASTWQLPALFTPAVVSPHPNALAVTVERQPPALSISCPAGDQLKVTITNASRSTTETFSLSGTKIIVPLSPEQFTSDNRILLRLYRNNQLYSAGIFRAIDYVEPAAGIPGAARLLARPNCTVWTAPSASKVAADAEVPEAFQPAARFSAAGNEYEAVQLIIRPEQAQDYQVTVADFSTEDGKILTAEHFQCFQLERVNVAIASDQFGYPGQWADPLVPLAGQFHAEPNVNNLFYLRVKVPAGTPSGFYRGLVMLKTANPADMLSIPVGLQVFDFDLPETTTMRSSYALTGELFDFMGLQSAAERQAAFDRTLALLKEYRIAPDNVFQFTPALQEDGALNRAELEAAGQKYLDEDHFNSFNPAGWMPTGHYPEFRAFLADHHWLEQCYFFASPADSNVEPPPDDGIKILKPLPRDPLQRMAESADAWLLRLHGLDPATIGQLGRNHELWWQVSSRQRYPYPGNNIDSPAVLPRLRFWLAESYGIDGSWYWAIDALGRLPDGNLRNPWEDAMTYTAEGRPRSNGDGLLIYPPNRQAATAPVTEAPLPSLRLEMIRDGLEDREYFQLLRQETGRISALLPQLSDDERQFGEELLKELSLWQRCYEQLVTTPTQYNANASELLKLRAAMARLLSGSRHFPTPAAPSSSPQGDK